MGSRFRYTSGDRQAAEGTCRTCDTRKVSTARQRQSEYRAVAYGHAARVLGPRRNSRGRANQETSTISFEDFRQVVRRFPPSHLLPVLAELALVGSEDAETRRAIQPHVQPWAIATVARESVLWGNEHRSSTVTPDALRRIFNAHNRVAEIDVRADEVDFLDIFTRVAYEQFPYQDAGPIETSRSHALLVEGLAEVSTKHFTLQDADRLLGAPLGKAVGATFLLHALAHSQGGWVDPAWMDRDNFAPIFDVWDREVVDLRIAQMTTTFEDVRRRYEEAPKPPPGRERYALNPLISTPFLKMGDGRILAPQPGLIMQTVSPGALYYRGVAAYGAQQFGSDLGLLTQHYVGRQLRILEPDAVVHPEIEYVEAKRRRDSVDWFILFDSLVVMVEVKSARFGLLDRAAAGDYKKRVHGLLAKATQQLIETSKRLDSGLDRFAHIPESRPRIGVIVTGEPFYLANTRWTRGAELPQTDFPVVVASLRDIEFMVCMPAEEVERRLTEIVNDPERSTWALDAALGLVGEVFANPILDAAWEAYPWPQPLNNDEQ